MSDPEDGATSPSDAQITSTLKRIVAQRFKADDPANLTLKRVRKAIEDELDLPANWLKEHDIWNAKSKELITAEVKRLEEVDSKDSDDDKPITTKPQRSVNGKATTTALPKKRKSPEKPKRAAKAKPKPKPRKKRRISSDEEDDASEDEAVSSGNDDDTPSPVTKKPATKSKAPPKARPKSKVVESDDDDEEKDVEITDIAPVSEAAVPAKQDSASEDEDDEPAPKVPPPQTDGNDSESSLSSLLDEPPTKKKRQKKSPTLKPSKAKTKTTPKTVAKKDAKSLTSDEEEIKRLQGWLLKCGIRKIWGKELKRFETPKAKIAHLKSMLADAGMTGRYSIEKARQIKEQRELAADLEAVTAFDQTWGNKEDKSRPREKGDMARDLGLDPALIDDGSDDED